MADYSDIIERAAQANNIDPKLLRGIIATESSGNPNAVSKTGAQGLMQIQPSNFKALGITNPTDPEQNIFGGAKLVSQLLDRFTDVPTALTHYIGGDNPKNYGPQTAAYPQKVLAAAGIGAQQMPQNNQAADAFSALPVTGIQSNSAPAVSTTPDAFSALPVTQEKAPALPAPAGAETPGVLASAAHGALNGIQNTGVGAQQLLGHTLSAIGFKNAGQYLLDDANKGSQAISKTIAPYEAAHPVATGVGRFGGGLVAGLPLAAATGGASTLAEAAGLGALSGGVSSALQPVDPSSQNYWGDKGGQAALGATAGAIVGPAAFGLGRLISPNVAPEVKMLMDKGITPTPGKILGGSAATLEDKATGLPIVGNSIVKAQQRAIEQFNRATYDDALAPLGQKIPNSVQTGSEAVSYVKNQIQNVYKAIEPKANFVADTNLSSDVNAIRTQLSQEAPGTVSQFDNIVKNQLTSKISGGMPFGANDIPTGGAMSGSQWGNTRASIRAAAQNQLTGNTTPDQRTLGMALKDLNGAVNAAVFRNSEPEVQQQLTSANSAYANYKQIEGAAKMAGASNNGNIFTPAQFNNSIRSGSSASQKATNSGLNADFGNAAQSVLGSKYPDSGTAGRLMLPDIAFNLATRPTATLATLGGAKAASLLYSQLGARGLAALLAGSRGAGATAVGDALSKAGPLVAPTGLAGLQRPQN